MRITKLRARLLQHPLPQYMVAAQIRLHPSQLSNYALGKTPIKLVHLERLCQVLECKREDLIGYYDNWLGDIEGEPNGYQQNEVS